MQRRERILPRGEPQLDGDGRHELRRRRGDRPHVEEHRNGTCGLGVEAHPPQEGGLAHAPGTVEEQHREPRLVGGQLGSEEFALAAAPDEGPLPRPAQAAREGVCPLRLVADPHGPRC